MALYYECQRCTACCRWPGQVPITEAEISRLAEFLGISEMDFIQRYTRLRLNRQGLALIEKENGECVFLDGQECRVQPVKPQHCLDFPKVWNFPGFEKVCRAILRDDGQPPAGQWRNRPANSAFVKSAAKRSGGRPFAEF